MFDWGLLGHSSTETTVIYRAIPEMTGDLEKTNA